MDNNLIDILTLDDGERDKFIRDYVCVICFGPLISSPTEDRRWIIHCPNCQIDITLIGAIHRAKLDRINEGRYQGRREMREKKKPRSVANILKDLGF